VGGHGELSAATGPQTTGVALVVNPGGPAPTSERKQRNLSGCASAAKAAIACGSAIDSNYKIQRTTKYCGKN
jgi:hypothetical protein